ncbi:MAG: hypothetical protein WDZ54_07525 [Sneathiella sp.]
MQEMRCWKIALLLGIALMISGCSSDVFKAVDRQVAGLFGESCSFTNLSSGNDFCPTGKDAHKQSAVYCYKTLGAVSCYAEENPYNTEQSERVRKVPALASSIGSGGEVDEGERPQSVKNDATAKE